jgi:hypothetical protein
MSPSELQDDISFCTEMNFNVGQPIDGIGGHDSTTILNWDEQVPPEDYLDATEAHAHIHHLTREHDPSRKRIRAGNRY